MPTLRLLHCLRDADLGGDTGLIDGFAAAAALRAADPAAFRLLTTVCWPFAYSDGDTELRARQPMISLTPAGRITAVRLNRSLQPLRGPAMAVEAAYGAYRTWSRLLARPEFTLTLRLARGDCLVFDNTRVLHARTAFRAAPARTGSRVMPRPARPSVTCKAATPTSTACCPPWRCCAGTGWPANPARRRTTALALTQVLGPGPWFLTLALGPRPGPRPGWITATCGRAR